MKKKTITVDGSYITLVPMGKEDYISLTDIDQRFEGNGRHIENWLRNQNTIEYLTVWETLYNPNFNSLQLQGIREKVGLNRFILSAKKWIELTNAIGLKASAGRYGGTVLNRITNVPDLFYNPTAVIASKHLKDK